MAPTVPTKPGDPTAADFAKHLVGEWRPVRPSPLYTLALFLVAGAMILLPLIYFGIIAGIGYGVYWNIVENMPDLRSGGGGGGRGVGGRSGRGSLLLLIAYIAPSIIGIILILFLLKPIFAPPGKRPEGFTVEPYEEPRLHAFVGMVCRTIGAPVPKVIEVDCNVNASASFRRGWLSLLLPGDLRLTIGMPLVAGMNVTQFAGILAHEFGHFAQGAAMRADWIIHAVMRWFARAAY